ncbi:hypothetical protein AQUCO_02000520v1 [Aquilegia coerulea]|uniref:GBF-interacting protein 1 N-terminal domain-containing protein n=1 Tax=Aquilegia coerulea TaxID=218851 RepID=A0A2G5DI22_AQUCA|nr:hypothetical protein AQUCO_02000520v1 [Aquilegia coerulea]
MVSSSSDPKLDEGSESIPSDSAGKAISVHEAIQSLKEVVRNHSDSDILDTLKEFNMDLNDAAQKLLNQDPFHEVKSRRDKKKENTSSKGLLEPKKLADQDTNLKGSSEPKKVTVQSTTVKGFSEPRRLAEHTQGIKFRTFADRNARRGGYVRNSLPGNNREFRVVRDNRVNHSINNEKKPASVQSSTSTSVQEMPYVSGRSTMKNPPTKKHIGSRNPEGQKSFEAVNGQSELVRGQVSNSNNSNRKGLLEENRAKTPNTVASSQGMKPHSSQPSATLASNSSVVGLYSSSSDPVHVPSNSRIPGTAGAIKREVGVVETRRQSSGNSARHSTAPSSSVSTSFSGKDISPISETVHPSSAVMKSDQVVLTSESESVVANKSLSNSQYVGKTNQLATEHQKAPQPNMEWKPKSSQKPSFISPMIGTTAASVSHMDDNLTDSKEADHLQENLSRASISENEHVIIPQHLRAPEADRTRLMFGSFGMEIDSTKSISSGFQGLTNQQQFNVEPSASVTAPSTSSEAVNQVDLLNGQVRNSGSVSPASIAVSENPSTDKREYANPGNLESYADIGMVQNNNPSYTLAESQQQDFHGLPSFVAYDSQIAYDMPFFRPVMDDSLRSQSVPSPGEALSSHMTNSIPTSSVAIVQQQPVPQMYPQVHVSHFPNYMPYRQFLSPVYVPPMAMPGYSGNPAYPHPSTGNSYLLMPGGSSHLAAGGLKYGATQYKPIPAGAPTGFGNYSNPTGYALNGPGTVGGATGLDDPTRMKYKDSNLYVPTPQAETSEVGIQTPREIPGIQSASYYNIPGQHPHAAYLPPHSGHPSFNGAATAQPTHVQFPGLYHPSAQQAAIASPHHMVPGMGSNVGVGVAAAASGAQIGAYQQPQLGHMNWNTNF